MRSKIPILYGINKSIFFALYSDFIFYRLIGKGCSEFRNINCLAGVACLFMFRDFDSLPVQILESNECLSFQIGSAEMESNVYRSVLLGRGEGSLRFRDCNRRVVFVYEFSFQNIGISRSKILIGHGIHNGCGVCQSDVLGIDVSIFCRCSKFHIRVLPYFRIKAYILAIGVNDDSKDRSCLVFLCVIFAHIGNVFAVVQVFHEYFADCVLVKQQGHLAVVCRSLAEPDTGIGIQLGRIVADISALCRFPNQGIISVGIIGVLACLRIHTSVRICNNHVAFAGCFRCDHEWNSCHRLVAGVVFQEIQSATLRRFQSFYLISSVIDGINPFDIGPYIAIRVGIEVDSIHLVIQLVAVRGLGFLDQDGTNRHAHLMFDRSQIKLVTRYFK